MAHFLLVHGSWHGGWCWERARPALEGLGHATTVLDLPAHGADTTPAWRATLGRYGARVAETAAGLRERPIVVGHSMGGLAISAAAGRSPDAFAGLIFLCAFVPLEGDSLSSLGARAPGQDASEISQSIRFRPAGPVVRPERAKSLFYGDCSDEDAAWATGRLRPDPWRPLYQKLERPTPASLPRGYVECTRDRAISLEAQQWMHRRAGIEAIETLETDHSPFLSLPGELAATLDRLAARLGETG